MSLFLSHFWSDSLGSLHYLSSGSLLHANQHKKLESQKTEGIIISNIINLWNSFYGILLVDLLALKFSLAAFAAGDTPYRTKSIPQDDINLTRNELKVYLVCNVPNFIIFS